jgi:hypothetical protein
MFSGLYRAAEFLAEARQGCLGVGTGLREQLEEVSPGKPEGSATFLPDPAFPSATGATTGQKS